MIGNIFGIAFGVLLLGALAAGVVYWLAGTVWFGAYGAYLYVRYARKGLCTQCHQPRQVVSRRVEHADQMFNPNDRIVHTVCSCGKETVTGNRRFAEW